MSPTTEPTEAAAAPADPGNAVEGATGTPEEGRAARAVREPASFKTPIIGLVVLVLCAAMALAAHGRTRFQLASASYIPVITLNATVVLIITSVLAAGLTALALLRSQRHQRVSTRIGVALGVVFVISFLTWAGAGRSQVIAIETILSSTLALSGPLVFGGLAGVLGERSGTINIAIEGQLLGGAFLAALVASITGSPWAGLIVAPLPGVIVALLLALFGLKYRVNQIVVGVVLNVLVSGLTGFLYSTVIAKSPGHLNAATRLPTLPVPLLSDIPILGPVLFRQSILVYIMYAAVGVLSFMLFRSRWGLRMRAVGEHPKAADTVGIKVVRTRVNNLMLGGALAGLGGAFFTIGSGLAFSKDISAGNGYIALAAMILGAWNPLGTLYAALLFGFATSVGQALSVVGSPIPANFILMIPYVVTILAVAGFVGKVRAPAAEGVPYP